MIALTLSLGCFRQKQSELVSPRTNGGSDAGSLPVPGPDYPPPCSPVSQPAPDGGIFLQDTPPPLSLGSSGNWSNVATDGDCANLVPAGPFAGFKFTGPAGEWCDEMKVDGHGDLAITLSPGTWYFPADGGPGTLMTNGSERQYSPFPSPAGFWGSFDMSCGGYIRQLDGDGHATPDGGLFKFNGGGPTSDSFGIISTYNGGFLEARYMPASDGGVASDFQLRWADDRLQPLGDWQTALPALDPTYQGDLIQIFLDSRNLALLLDFSAPAGFGPPPGPETWVLKARWVGSDGALGSVFTPPAPAFMIDDKPFWFADWGNLVALPGGGFAAFHKTSDWYAGYMTPIAPSGWYALYPSGESRVTSAVPAWLQGLDGSLRPLGDGRGFLSMQQDPTTCTRTVSVISNSGRLCSSISLSGSELCGTFIDRISPDGTVLLVKEPRTQEQCDIRWWPALAGFSAPHPSAALAR